MYEQLILINIFYNVKDKFAFEAVSPYFSFSSIMALGQF